VFLSPQIVTALKLLALEDMAAGSRVASLTLVSADAMLAAAMRAWCRVLGSRFEWRRAAAPRRTWWRRLPRKLPELMQALSFLVWHYLRRRPLAAPSAGIARAPVTLIAYLFNFNAGDAAKGRFVSKFWGGLPALLAARGIEFQWLVQFLEHEQLPDAHAAARLVRRLNDEPGQPPMLSIDGELGAATLKGALRDYARLLRAAWRLRGLRARFVPRDSRLDFWPLFAADWRRSLRGAEAMQNCVALNAIERAVRRLPRQRFGLYLQENIAWEFALLHAWRAAGHGPLIGVPHSTVRFWDLRYFFDQRSLAREGRVPLPLPDRVAVNGPAAEREYRASGYPGERLAPIEALRYSHLTGAARERPGVAAGGAIRVLALTDYMPGAARAQMQWLGVAMRAMPPGSRLVVKAHPACPVRLEDFPGLDARLTAEPIEVLLDDCDVAFVSNTTSAGVDAFSSGVPVVSVRDGESFNFSPLRGLATVEFVNEARELAPALTRAAAAAGRAREQAEFFFLDRDLPRWRQLIGSLESLNGATQS
jgi:surface carbohydrate biosynthesis protein (TIGR04326 family)